MFFSEISSSRIDRIYASNDVNVVSVRVSPNHFSDHNALIAQVAFGSETSVSSSTPTSAIIYDAYTSVTKKLIFLYKRREAKDTGKTT